jgi:rRNA maturation protein Rpf1
VRREALTATSFGAPKNPAPSCIPFESPTDRLERTMTKKRGTKRKKASPDEPSAAKNSGGETIPEMKKAEPESSFETDAMDEPSTLEHRGDDEAESKESVSHQESQEAAEPPTAMVSDGRYRNKQRCLVLCSRGVTARYRHLLEDLRTLMPHHKKESKLDPGDDGFRRAVNDIAEMRSCTSVLFLECRKRQDAYLWLSKVGSSSGPSAKFHVTNIHTMDELRLTGNCMKGSRPILTFDESFQKLGHLKLLKELFVDVFGTPRGHPKSKPFVDRVMAFYYADKKVSSMLG